VPVRHAAARFLNVTVLNVTVLNVTVLNVTVLNDTVLNDTGRLHHVNGPQLCAEIARRNTC
jgi:hypothetical protein